MISVIIPAYNCSATLSLALDSLCSQTKKAFMTIVIDDYSTEDIKSIIENYKDKLNIFYFRNEENLGPGLTRQRGIDLSYSNHIKYCMFLDSDDLLYPRAVESLSREIQANNCDFIQGRIYCEAQCNLGYPIELDKSLTWCHAKAYNIDFLKKNKIEFSKKIKYNEDAQFNLECFLKAKNIKNLDEVYYLWRNNGTSITRSIKDNFNKFYSWEYVYGQCEAILNSINYNFTENKKENSIIASILNIYYFYQLNYEQFQINLTLIEPIIYQVMYNNKIIEIFNKKENLNLLCDRAKQSVTDYNHSILLEHSFMEWIKKFSPTIYNKIKEFNNETL